MLTKSESTVRPEAVTVVRIDDGDTAELVLVDDVAENDGMFSYDEYRETVRWRVGLAADAAENRERWLVWAKGIERAAAAAVVRERRNALLTACDWTVAADSPLTAAEKSRWKAYRKALRDITVQVGFPFSVVWPMEP